MVHPDNGIVFNTKKKRKETKNHQAMKRHVNMLGPFSCLTLCNPMECSPTRLLCPWNSLGKNTGVDCHALLQGIFPTRDWTHVSCIGRWILYHKCHLGSPEKTWRNLKSILPNERSQSEKVTYCMIPNIWHSGKGKTMETIKRSVIVRVREEEG